MRNGIWGIKWSRDRWRHVTPKGQTHDPSRPRTRNLPIVGWLLVRRATSSAYVTCHAIVQECWGPFVWVFLLSVLILVVSILLSSFICIIDGTVPCSGGGLKPLVGVASPPLATGLGTYPKNRTVHYMSHDSLKWSCNEFGNKKAVL